MKGQIIDFHHHLLEEENYAENLIKKMDELGIKKCCINGLGIGKNNKFNWKNIEKFNLAPLTPDNSDVLKVCKKYPDRLLPIGVINLGIDSPEKVQELYNLGFRGLKITRPKKDYNSDEYFPIYEAAECLNMFILFHTGFILTTPFDKEDDICSDRMRPVKLDRVARCFPNLKIIIAHLGFPWLEEGATLVRYHPNVYVDLTSSSLGWRNRLSVNDIQKLFYWNGAYEKIIFGTDLHYKDMEESLNSQKLLFDALNLSKEIKEKIFFKNALSLLNEL